MGQPNSRPFPPPGGDAASTGAPEGDDGLPESLRPDGAPDEVGHPARTRSFTRRGGRMPPRHHRALAEHGEKYLLDVPRVGHGSLVEPGFRLDLAQVFGRDAPVIVEIGSGSGDCTVHAAVENPHVDFVALEVWQPGVAQTLAKAAHAGIRNLRVAPVDAGQALAELFAPGSLSQVWTFFPDPWPKKKHHKRRLVSDAFAPVVASVLEPGGRWRLATDWADYAWQFRDVVENCAEFDNPHRGRLADPADGQVDPRGEHGGFAPRFSGRVLTRFENKGLRAERIVRDVEAVRR